MERILSAPVTLLHYFVRWHRLFRRVGLKSFPLAWRGPSPHAYAKQRCICWLWILSWYLFYIQTDETFQRKYDYHLGEDVVYLILHVVTEAVDGDEVRLLVTCKPYVMDITQKQGFHLAARVGVVHIGIEDNLEHHAGMVGIATHFAV